MSRGWKFALSCISWGTAYVLCWSQGWLYFILRQTRNWRTYFQGEKWQGTQMKNLLSWSRGDKVHCDYIDFKLLCRAGTSLCLVVIMMRRRKEEGRNTPLFSASKYFVTSKITEPSHPPDVPDMQRQGRAFWHPQWSWKGIRGTVRLKCGFFLLLSSLPLCSGCLNRRSMRCPVQCVTDACSLCVPPALRDDINRKQSMSEFDVFWVRSTPAHTTTYS